MYTNAGYEYTCGDAYMSIHTHLQPPRNLVSPTSTYTANISICFVFCIKFNLLLNRI